MIINEIQNESANNYLFKNSEKFISLRKNIIKDFNISPKIKKNNESLKHLHSEVFQFNYNYKNSKNDITFNNIDEINRINIKVIDGKISSIDKNLKQNINFYANNVVDENNLVENEFIKFQNLFNEDYILNLNSLLLNSGYQIYIGDNLNLNIYISNTVSEKDLTIFQKNLIICSKNSNVKIIEEFIVENKSNSNVVNYINLEESSNLDYLTLQKNSDQANIHSTSYAVCKNNSKYKNLILNISQCSSRNHHYVNLAEENSSATLDGIFFGSKNQCIDNKTQINHNSPNCLSSQRYKGILTGSAKASYLSKTFVDEVAQKTEAYQLSKGILLSDQSYFHSKPELKIFADDVKCSHGSTIGPIDSELLFYLRSRGLDKKISTTLLIMSFFNDIIEDNDNIVFNDKFKNYSNTWLKENII